MEEIVLRTVTTGRAAAAAEQGKLDSTRGDNNPQKLSMLERLRDQNIKFEPLAFEVNGQSTKSWLAF